MYCDSIGSSANRNHLSVNNQEKKHQLGYMYIGEYHVVVKMGMLEQHMWTQLNLISVTVSKKSNAREVVW